jgi:putative mRNA 3-end processing factor
MECCSNWRIKLEQYDFSAHAEIKNSKHNCEDFCDRGTKAVFTMHGDIYRRICNLD